MLLKLWCWRRFLRVPWTARRSNQSILKEISPEYSLEGLMLNSSTLATCCEELTRWRRPWCWKGLKAAAEGDSRGWGGWWRHWLDGQESEQAPGVGDGQGSLVRCSPWGCRVRHDWATELNKSIKGKKKDFILIEVPSFKCHESLWANKILSKYIGAELLKIQNDIDKFTVD